ncbi:MAG: hypothetical protein JSR61_08765 [Proteobacteria bacterium]|nr:hypothetical protein [Pseudomonadota bacterium]
MTKAVLAALAILSAAGSAHAQYYNSNRGYNSGSFGYGTGSNSSSHYVQPHYNNNGGYTSGHYQTNPNSTTLDNYGTRGNYNPYTGQTGRRNPW